ncbi:hypothetical protein CLOM_g3186 [Closterium sp. NIES-68]|nr:hypothetical protein CLOM_g3186 [Closterium sp. NIES-68]GJP59365.1 hypothetical protein CLOP_g11459 [Closterium sp. NIES-67]GJP76327.1 hypothetical protein CLOP_g6789 [Closterium sp. NIES-67]
MVDEPSASNSSSPVMVAAQHRLSSRAVRGSLSGIRLEPLKTNCLDDDVSRNRIVYLGDHLARFPCYVNVTKEGETFPYYVNVTQEGAIRSFHYATELSLEDRDGDAVEELRQQREEILGSRNGTPRPHVDATAAASSQDQCRTRYKEGHGSMPARLDSDASFVVDDEGSASSWIEGPAFS